MVGSGSKSALSELSRTPQLLVAKNNREHGCQFQADYEPKQPLKCHVKCRHSVLKACENEQSVTWTHAIDSKYCLVPRSTFFFFLVEEMIVHCLCHTARQSRVKNNRRGGGKSETITLRQGLKGCVILANIICTNGYSWPGDEVLRLWQLGVRGRSCCRQKKTDC